MRIIVANTLSEQSDFCCVILLIYNGISMVGAFFETMKLSVSRLLTIIKKQTKLIKMPELLQVNWSVSTTIATASTA